MSIETNMINIGMAAPTSMGMVYAQGASSIGLFMQNAVLNEKLSQITNRAGLEQCLVLILAAGAAGAAKGK